MTLKILRETFYEKDRPFERLFSTSTATVRDAGGEGARYLYPWTTTVDLLMPWPSTRVHARPNPNDIGCLGCYTRGRHVPDFCATLGVPREKTFI